MERAARLSGSRFGYIVGDSALVAMALYRFALDRAAAHGHTPLLPPVLVREQAMYGTGFFPTERSNIYALEDDGLYLTGTSEVALAGFHMDEILDELPLRYSAFSTCFRRESGAAGKDTRGMFRVHQFNKVELFVFCEPERSGEEHDRLLAIEEELVQALGLPYRVVNVAAGDLGDPAAKKYDIEAWFPSQQRYREITSTSNTTDQGAAGAVAGDPIIELLAGEISQDLARGGALMNLGIGVVLELPGQIPAIGVGQFDRLVDHADGALGGRRQDHLRAEETHQLAPLDAEGLGHGDDQRIALGRAHHRKPDTGVTAGRLDHGLAGL